MTETSSTGNLVNALNSVRSDYHEHLKSIPQYQAFLLVESSTQKVLETLDEFVNSRVPSIAAEVISSLETAKTKFKEHLTSVPEYRALLAIDKLIDDVSIDLGIQPAPAQTAVPAVEPGTPSHETISTHPEADLAVSPSERAALPEMAEIASTHQIAPAPPEPDLAASPSEHAAMPEVAEITSTHQMTPAQPEPDLAASIGTCDHAGGCGDRLNASVVSGPIRTRPCCIRVRAYDHARGHGDCLDASSSANPNPTLLYPHPSIARSCRRSQRSPRRIRWLRLNPNPILLHPCGIMHSIN